MIELFYKRNKISTTDELTVSVADIRDLVNANNLNRQDMKDEVYCILASIVRKNKLEKDTLGVEFVELISNLDHDIFGYRK